MSTPGCGNDRMRERRAEFTALAEGLRQDDADLAALTVRPREQTVGDRVTVEQALEAAQTVVDEPWEPDGYPRTLARFVLQEHGCICPEVPCPYTAHIAAEPPRPELPPTRKGWVLTGEFREPRLGEYVADSLSGEPFRYERTTDLGDGTVGPFARRTRERFIYLKVPDPPEEGWTVTRYEEPQKGAMVWSARRGWERWAWDFPPADNHPYPDGRRFIAEQDDLDDDRTRLAKALPTGPPGWRDLTVHEKNVWVADRLLALGVKAPDPVKKESL